MTDYESIQRRHNITVGIFVIMAICAFGWLIFKFGDLPIAVSKFRTFHVVVQFASAPGVQRNTPVQLGGYQVGRVIAVMPPIPLRDLNTNLEYYQTRVVLGIEKKYSDIPSNVKVKLITRGLGSSYIDIQIDPTLSLEPIDPNRPETRFLIHGMLLQGSTGMLSEFFPQESQEKLNQVVKDLSTLLNNANDIIGDPESKENIKATLANLSEATAQATKALKEIKRFATTGAVTVKNADAQITKATTALVQTSEGIDTTVAELKMILGKINSGHGTAGKLLNDGRLYENLLETTLELQAGLEQFKLLIAQWRKEGTKLKW